MKPYLFLFALCGLSAISCQNSTTSALAALPYYQEANFTPHWFAVDSDSLANFHRIPDFWLVNQMGDTITQETFEDKIYITDFFFTTCPGICPKMTKNMVLLQEAFREAA
ncbi:MAG: SCO family protein [Bacteroidota bacterium]